MMLVVSVLLLGGEGYWQKAACSEVVQSQISAVLVLGWEVSERVRCWEWFCWGLEVLGLREGDMGK